MTRTGLRLVWYWGPLFFYAAAIYYLSSLSNPPIPKLNIPFADKLLHAVEYAGLGLLLCRGLAAGSGLSLRAAAVVAVALGALYGAADEIHQSFVPGRSPELLDLAVDVAGALTGAGAWVAVARRRGAARDEDPPADGARGRLIAHGRTAGATDKEEP